MYRSQQLHTSRASLPRIENTCRFEPVVHLMTGDIVGATAIHRIEFEETPRFGALQTLDHERSAAVWTAEQIRSAATAAGRCNSIARPIHISAPLTAIGDPATPEACDQIIQRTTACSQEFVVEISDAALCSLGEERLERVEAFRRRGFRVGLDARNGLHAPLCEPLKLLLDSIRIRVEALREDPDFAECIADAAASGLAVIAEGSKYRDGEELAAYGVELGFRVKTDA